MSGTVMAETLRIRVPDRVLLANPLHRQFSYDSAGRLLAKQDGAGSPRYTVSYDGQGRAREIATPVFLDTFDYDPSAYRIRKNASDGYRKYLLEGEHLEAVYGAGDELKETYLRGVVVDELVSGYVYPSGTLHENRLGTSLECVASPI